MINQIYCNDFRAIGKELISEGIKVDFIITDPPYGVDFKYDNYDDTFENWKSIIGDLIPLSEKITNYLLTFPSGRFQNEKYIYKNYSPKWRLCWYKGATSTRTCIGFQNWELMFVFGKHKKSMHDFFQAASIYSHMHASIKNNHPCPKPEAWAIWLISKMSDEGDIIFDPFCGSGTVMSVAKKLNRRYIGCDISQHYIDFSRMRLENTHASNGKVKVLSLF